MAARRSEKWIQSAIENPGALRRQLGIKKGKKIPLRRLRAAAKKPGKLGRRARLALTLRKLSARRKARSGTRGGRRRAS